MILLNVDHFDKSIEGFANVEYLVVLNAIIYGFIISMYFSGWGDMIQSRKNLKVHWEHLAWTIFAFTMFISNWYGTWQRVKFINDNIGYFFYSLVPLLLFYFVSVLLFPKLIDKNQYIDLKDHLARNKSGIFTIYVIYFLVTIISSKVYMENSWFEPQNLYRLGGAILALVAALTKNRIVHLVFLAVGFAMLVVFLATIPRVE